MTESTERAPRYSFQALIIALTVLLLITPQLLATAVGGIIFEAILSCILLLSVYAIGQTRRQWIPAACLAAPSLIISWIVLFHAGNPELRLISAGLNVALFL